MACSKTFAVEEFKSSSEFQGAIEYAASKYFDEGLDFCKWQLRRHHPTIDLEGMGLDHDLPEEEDEAKEKKNEEEEKDKEGNGEKGDTSPLFP